MTTNLPKVIVVGDPRLGTMLATCGAQWLIQPVAPTVTAMWDSIDSGQLDPDVAAIIFTDGTGTTPDELELSLLSFSSYCHTFLFADPARAKTIIDRARQLAPNVPNSDPNAPIWALPVLDANKAIQTIQQITTPGIQWGTPAPTPTPTPTPPAPPAPQPVVYTNPVPPAPTTSQPFAQQPNQTYTPQTSPKNYDQAQAYGDHIVEQAQHSIPKLPNAIPGQMTIACMSSKGGSGKALWVETPIPTPDGFRNMGDLTEGDYVYDETGTPTIITHAFDIMHDRQCYEVAFTDGSTLIADEDHLWSVMDMTKDEAYRSWLVMPTKQIVGMETVTRMGDPRWVVPSVDNEKTGTDSYPARGITRIRPVNSVPVRCIAVAADSHLYLAGETYIPTHNSTTALCLAGTIARASAAANNPKKVVLVDLDTRDGQVGSLIGLFMPTALNIRVLPIRDAASVKANLVHDKKMGIDALLAPVRPRNADDVGPEFYRDVIGILQTTHDIVILDCSVNYLDPLLGVGFAMSDEILFVTTLATTSVQGMARSLTELFADPSDGGLGIPREKVGIVANQVINNVGMGRDKLLKAALGAPLIGQIPSDQDAVLIATNSTKMHELLRHPRLGPAYFKLAEACLPGVPMAPLTAESAAVKQTGQPEQPGKRRLFGR